LCKTRQVLFNPQPPEPASDRPLPATESENKARHSFEKQLPAWYDKVYKETRDSTEDMPDILLAELIALFSEWMFAFKVTDACAKAVYVLLETLMPSDTNIGSWPQLKSALESVTKNSCEEIDICPNDCIAFISCKHPKLAYYKHAHRTWCPYCGSDRYLQVDGVQRSAKRGFYFLLRNYFQGLFNSDELAAHLPWAAGKRISGHVKQSYGFHKKVQNNHYA